MEIRHLEYVLEVIRHESFTKAAEALHITQPTISKMIKNLEEELGTTLFIRSGKKVKLTDAGHAIVSQSQDIVRLFKNLQSELEDVTNFRKGLIRIGLPPMIGSAVFPSVMSRFMGAYPNLTIRLVEEGALKVESEVAGGEVDVGIVVLPTRDDRFDYFSMIKESLRVVLHPGHPLADRSELTLAELEQERFIMYREDFALHAKISEECARLGFKPRVLLESAQWDFIYEMTAAEVGISLLPESICRTLNPARVRSVPLIDPVILWHIALIWPKDGYLSFAARELIRFTKQFYGADETEALPDKPT